MHWVALCFLFGILIFQSLGDRPSVFFLAAAFLLPSLLTGSTLARLTAIIIAGFLWALFHAYLVSGAVLPPEQSGTELRLSGTIDNLPERAGQSLRFSFALDDGPVKRVRVSWHQPSVDLMPGDRWELNLRLRSPNGLRNPGGFDYERWLFLRGYAATASVRDPQTARYLGQSTQPLRALDRQRAKISKAIEQRLPEGAHTGVLRALAIGDRGGITRAQWDALLHTGTNHLMAISGLHVGLVAGLVFALIRYIWQWVPPLVLRLPAQRAAVMGAWCAACAYAALAGFSIPTQRALAMLSVALGALWLQRAVRPTRTIGLALFLVLLIDPRAPLDAGFWLSFAAVIVIIYSLAGRLSLPPKWVSIWRVQWVAGVGLLPITWVMFQHGSIISPLANLIAVPWVSFLVVPLTLMGAALLPIAPDIAGFLWWLAHGLTAILWPVLQWFADLPGAYWQMGPPLWTLWPALLGLIWWMAPAGLPGRWLGLILLIPLFTAGQSRLEEGSFHLRLLDVGQGLAAVVRTRHHLLVYDTGAQLSPRFNMGDAAVLPYLRQSRAPSIDVLMISHGDNDHIGGAAAIIRQWPIHTVLSRNPERFTLSAKDWCEKGQQWFWDGVHFQVLHPPPFWGDDNRSSCVLHVQGQGGSLLLAGDVEDLGEVVLLRHARDQLSADVLLLPHHGARGTLRPSFLEAVSPQVALVSRGFENSHRHPHPEIRQRLRSAHIPLLDTAAMGAIEIEFDAEQGVLIQGGFRHQSRRQWTRISPIDWRAP